MNKTVFDDLNIYTGIFSELDSKNLKNIVDNYKDKENKTIIILISKNKNKVTAVIGVSDKLSEYFNAIDLIKEIIPLLGGKGGGGKNTLAQGGGNSPQNAEEAIKATTWARAALQVPHMFGTIPQTNQDAPKINF